MIVKLGLATLIGCEGGLKWVLDCGKRASDCRKRDFIVQQGAEHRKKGAANHARQAETHLIWQLPMLLKPAMACYP